MDRRPAEKTDRRTWLLIFFAFTCFVFALGGLSWMETHRAKHAVTAGLGPARPIITTLAMACLAASVLWLRFTVGNKMGARDRPAAPTAMDFQTNIIIAQTLSFACTLSGYFLVRLGSPFQEFIPFAVGNLFIDFAFILPRGLRFWSAQT